MSVPEKQKFEALMQQNESLRLEVASQKTLVLAIQKRGEEDLRAYLKKNTSTKKSLFVYYKTWVFASAAVVLIALSASVFIIFNNKNAASNAANQTGESTIAKNEDKSSKYPYEQLESKKPTGPIIKSADNATTKDQGDVDGIKNVEAEAQEDNDIAAESGTEIDINSLQVLGRLSLKPILLTDEFNQVEKKISIEVPRPGADFKNMDSALAVSKLPISEQFKWDAPASVKFKFTQSANPSKEVIVESNSNNQTGSNSSSGTAPNEITLVNVPYDNQAIIYFYKDKYYLKTGPDLFEIKLDKKKYQKLNQVTDHKIIEVINSKK